MTKIFILLFIIFCYNILSAQDTYIYLVYNDKVDSIETTCVKSLGIQDIKTAKDCQLRQTYLIEMENPAYTVLKITPQTQEEKDYLDNLITTNKILLLQKERLVTKYDERIGGYIEDLEIEHINKRPKDFGLYK